MALQAGAGARHQFVRAWGASHACACGVPGVARVAGAARGARVGPRARRAGLAAALRGLPRKRRVGSRRAGGARVRPRGGLVGARRARGAGARGPRQALGAGDARAQLPPRRRVLRRDLPIRARHLLGRRHRRDHGGGGAGDADRLRLAAVALPGEPLRAGLRREGPAQVHRRARGGREDRVELAGHADRPQERVADRVKVGRAHQDGGQEPAPPLEKPVRRALDQLGLRAVHGALEQHGEVERRVGQHLEQPPERDVQVVQVDLAAPGRLARERVQGDRAVTPVRRELQRAVRLGRAQGLTPGLGPEHPDGHDARARLGPEEGQHRRQVGGPEVAGVVPRQQARPDGHVEAGVAEADPVVRPARGGLVLALTAGCAGRAHRVGAGRARAARVGPGITQRARAALVGGEVQELAVRAVEREHLHVIARVRARERRDELLPVLEVRRVHYGARGQPLEQPGQQVLREPRAVERRAVGDKDLQGEGPRASPVRRAGALLQHEVEGPAGRAVGAERVGVRRARGRLVPARAAQGAGPAGGHPYVHEGPRGAWDERDGDVHALALR